MDNRLYPLQRYKHRRRDHGDHDPAGPTSFRGRDKFLYERQKSDKQARGTETGKKEADRQKDQAAPCSGVAAMTPLASEMVSSVAMNALRRPMRSAIQPQKMAPSTVPAPVD